MGSSLVFCLNAFGVSLKDRFHKNIVCSVYRYHLKSHFSCFYWIFLSQKRNYARHHLWAKDFLTTMIQLCVVQSLICSSSLSCKLVCWETQIRMNRIRSDTATRSATLFWCVCDGFECGVVPLVAESEDKANGLSNEGMSLDRWRAFRQSNNLELQRWSLQNFAKFWNVDLPSRYFASRCESIWVPLVQSTKNVIVRKRYKKVRPPKLRGLVG